MIKMHWGRKVVIGLGVVFLLLGVWCLVAGWRGNQEFYAWQTAVPVRMTLDLRMPGRYEALYTQTCSSAHGTELELVTGETNGLPGLQGVVLVRGENGREVAREEFAGENMKQSVGLAVFSKGVYKMEVIITKGATGLTTTNHAIVGRYLLCGLERAPAAIANIIGGLCLFLALLGGIVTFRYLRRRKQPA